MRALPTLGGCSAEAYGINNQGDVVGRAEMPHLPMQPVLWTLAPDGSVSSVRALGGVKQPVTGAAYQVSERIDNIVQAVGYTVASKGASQATPWTIK